MLDFGDMCRNLVEIDRSKTGKNAGIICLGDAHASWSWPYVVQSRDKSRWTMTSSELTTHLVATTVTFRWCSPHFTVKSYGYRKCCQVWTLDIKKKTDVQRQCLLHMSANRPNIWFTRIGKTDSVSGRLKPPLARGAGRLATRVCLNLKPPHALCVVVPI